MPNSAMKNWLETSWLTGINQLWIEQLYKDFLNDPSSVDNHWSSIFRQNFAKEILDDKMISKEHISSTQMKVLRLIDAFRFRGHQHANLDPLGLWTQERVPELDPLFHDIKKTDFQKRIQVNDFYDDKNLLNIGDLYLALKTTYCSSVGVEYMHISNAEEKNWIQQNIESVRGHAVFSNSDKKIFLKELSAAEGFERYLGAKFPGAKRFSLEGGEALLPMLKEVVRYAGRIGIEEIVFGMAHRGRLNVLVNILGKNPLVIFEEFSGKYQVGYGTGDVKYHMGYSSDIKMERSNIHLVLAFNPSHLEIVNPVVMGSVRARLERLKVPDSNKVLPITIHGDAAVIGQGVMQETLNMSQVRGYEIGGTIRIIINNQIGFTTSLNDARSTQYCSDIGKMIQAPVFHVNADDIEATVFVMRLALNFRKIFKKDVFIDLVCYRRNGHNEADEPSATQPIMYQKIKHHPTTRQIYVNKLVTEQVISMEDSQKMLNQYREALDLGKCVVDEKPFDNLKELIWSSYLPPQWNEIYPVSVELKRLEQLAKCISNIPKYIKMQSRVAKIYHDRADMATGNLQFDWGGAENLAYATLLDQGITIRLSGEDVGRGTFFHRHAIVHNQINGSTYIPLQNINNKQGKFQVWDSVLSEEAVLAFEYGYATTEPRTLTIWEAQFGDFANGAQVVIDQFISSSEQKWGRFCGMVMLLPHGYEGQGPEHSSARLERYLQLCAQQNLQVCIPSTPAQIYHLLRRQALRKMRRPLIVISPKSLLRHPLATSSITELANGTFQLAIDEIDTFDKSGVKRIILCSGKVYYELIKQRRKNNQKNIIIMRLEQLYPFPQQILQKMLQNYSHVQDFIWCQEEPLNQGAWYYIQHYLKELIPSEASLQYVARPSSASPAVGYISVHQQQQQALLNEALIF
ncbi:MAG: 2-oxoglutarate dehydrogenase E1 component [Candidatus Dasytiphilus stammeri]